MPVAGTGGSDTTQAGLLLVGRSKEDRRGGVVQVISAGEVWEDLSE